MRILLTGLSLALAVVVLVLATNDRLGRLLLHAGHPALAARLLHDPAWRGVAHYQTGSYDTAIRDWKQSNDNNNAYNLGNALARDGKLQSALKAYDIALKRNPEDQDALANRKLVLAALAAQRSAGSQPVGSANASGGRESSAARSQTDQGGDDASSQGDGMAGDRQASGEAARGGRNKAERRGEASTRTAEQGQGSASGSASDTMGRAGEGGGTTSRAETDLSQPGNVQSGEQELAQATSQWFASIPDEPLHFVRLRIQAERGKRLAAGTALQAGGGQW
ncbi:tetratricopeptide repeat protein [Mesorhizobium sp. 1B3]|uniref:tetratricopeptide repeat protein n=1 Tax=Mesorhizobium sp. 1B3 TaxID=3243599 RepID=UPI003D97D957